LKAVKFILAGTLNTALNYSLYVMLVYIGVYYNLALAIEYGVGIVTGYLLNRFWTFSSHGQPKRGFLKYCATYVSVFALNFLLLNLLVVGTSLGPVLGQLLALGFAASASYLLQNHWVFRYKPIDV
jgi:putative flippase GtrA